MNRAEPPSHWPEMFPDPDPHCNHQFHWDNADSLYRCLMCDETRGAPADRFANATIDPGAGGNKP